MKRLSRSLSRALANDCTFFSHFSLLPWNRRLYSNYWIYFLYVYMCHISRDVEVLIHFYTLSGKKAGAVPFGKHASWIGHVPWQNRRLRKDLLVFYCCSWPTATLFYQKVFSLYIISFTLPGLVGGSRFAKAYQNRGAPLARCLPAESLRIWPNDFWYFFMLPAQPAI